MGQASATLAITTDHPYGLSGGTIQGKIYLDIRPEEYELDRLQLQLIGEEETNKAGRSQVLHCTHKFLERSFTLANFQHGYTVRGQYEYPFEVQLPYLRYGPMELSYFDDVMQRKFIHCRIHYYLQVKIIRKTLISQAPVHKQALYLLPVSSSGLSNEDLLPSYAPPKLINLYLFDFIPNGRLILSLFTPTGIISPGEHFVVSYLVCNKSSAQLLAVEITVIEEILWSVNTRHISTRQMRVACVKSEDVHLTSLIHASNQEGGRGRRRIATSNDQIIDKDLLIEIKASLDTMEHTLTAQLSEKARPSFSGNLVAVRHFINMRVITPFGTNDAEITLPIFVEAPSATVAHLDTIEIPSEVSERIHMPDALPADWMPIVADSVQVSCQQPSSNSEVHTPETINKDGEQGEQGKPVLEEQAVVSAEVVSNPERTTDHIPEISESLNPSSNVNGASSPTQTSPSSDHPLEVMRAWLEENSADMLTPEDFLSIYQMVSNPSDQIGLTSLLAQFEGFVTCEHVRQALNGCQKMVRMQVARKLLGVCIDRMEKKQVVVNDLTVFEKVCLQDCWH